MKSILKYLSFFLLLLSFGACTSSRYIHHAPIEANHQRLQKQYDFKISGSVFNGIIQRNKDLNNNFQISFSPLKQIGLQLGRYNFNSSSTKIDSWKGALGGYYHFNLEHKKRKKQSKYSLSKGISIDLYSGIEWKKIRQNGIDRNGIEKALLKSRNFFIESGIQYQTKLFGIGSTLKFNSINYEEGNYNHEIDLRHSTPQSPNNILLDHFLIIKDNAGPYNFIEGSIYLITGDQRANLYAGYTRSFQPINDSFVNVLYIAYAGLNLNIDCFYDSYLKKRKQVRKKK